MIRRARKKLDEYAPKQIVIFLLGLFLPLPFSCPKAGLNTVGKIQVFLERSYLESVTRLILKLPEKSI